MTPYGCKNGRKVDPDAKSGEVSVPEHGVLVIDRETVDNVFGGGEMLVFRHLVILLEEQGLRLEEMKQTVSVSKATEPARPEPHGGAL